MNLSAELSATRRVLHAVAELLIARPQYTAGGDIRLAARPGGFGQVPTLWPEHFDIGISVAEINYGVSPGDAVIGEPYAYVGAWQVPVGAFWNQPFGAARPLAQFPAPQAMVEFFRAGRDVAAGQQPGQGHPPRT